MMCTWWQIEIKIGQAWKCILIFISNWCHLITISHDQGDKICSFMVICIYTPLIIKLIFFICNVTLLVSQTNIAKYFANDWILHLKWSHLGAWNERWKFVDRKVFMDLNVKYGCFVSWNYFYIKWVSRKLLFDIIN